MLTIREILRGFLRTTADSRVALIGAVVTAALFLVLLVHAGLDGLGLCNARDSATRQFQRAVRLAGLSIDFLAVPDLDDGDRFLAVINPVQDPIVALPNAVLLGAGEFLTAGRAWIRRERPHAKNQPLPVLLRIDRLEFFRRRGCD